MRVSYATLVAAATVLFAPVSGLAQSTTDTTHRPAPPRLIKAGVRYLHPGQWYPTLAYEWQAARRLTAEAAVAYGHLTQSVSWQQYSATAVRRYEATEQQQQTVASLQVRYYVRRRGMPFAGWYGAAGTQATYHRYHDRLTLGGTGSFKSWRLSIAHSAQVGYQCSLGPRITLDAFAGVIGLQRSPYVHLLAGTQAGWRLL